MSESTTFMGNTSSSGVDVPAGGAPKSSSKKSSGKRGSTKQSAAHGAGADNDTNGDGGGGGDESDDGDLDPAGEVDDDAPLDLKGFTFSPTSEGVMSKHIANEKFNAHWTAFMREHDLSNDHQSSYLLAILMDMALNGTSSKRNASNVLIWNGSKYPTTYVTAFGQNEGLRQFGRAKYGLFLNTLTQDTKKARELCILISKKLGGSSSMAPYNVDFVDISKVPAALQAYVKLVANHRLSDGSGGVSKFLAQQDSRAKEAVGEAPLQHHGNTSEWF